MNDAIRGSQSSRAYSLGGLALMISLASILTALGFQYIGGYLPCPLCLMQRWAYYAAIPILFVAMALAVERPRVAAVLFGLAALAFLGNAGLGAYHAGVEWKFWPGPDTCAAVNAMPASAGDLLADIEHPVVRCDEPAWRLFGLSFAGWNVVICLLLAFLAFTAAQAARESRSNFN